MKGGVYRGAGCGCIRLPASASRGNHRPRLSCCWKLPAIEQTVTLPESKRQDGREDAPLPDPISFSLLLFSLSWAVQFPLLPFSLSSFLFFLLCSSSSFYIFPLYHVSSPKSSTPTLIYYWIHRNEVTFNQYKSIMSMHYFMFYGNKWGLFFPPKRLK